MRVLVFDDEADVRFLFSVILEGKGHTVSVRENCNSLFADIRTFQPEAIFLDNYMPGKTGKEAVFELKRSREFKDIPVVLCSANLDAALGEEEARADFVLHKPFTIAGLEDIMRQLE